MKNLTATICLTLALLLGSAGMGWSTDPVKGYCLAGTKHSHYPIFGKCSASYEKGDYATALREWTPLAKLENSSAQYNLGQMYRNENRYKPAVKWYRLAAEQGDA